MAPAASRKKKLPPKRTGRPRKEITAREVRKLCKIGCTNVDIADFFEISADTFERRKADDPEIAAAVLLGRAEMRMSLRRQQWKSAFSSSSARSAIAMQIWLGKQHLGQSDKVEDTTPLRPAEEGVMLPAALSPEDHAAVVEKMRLKGALPGQSSTVN